MQLIEIKSSNLRDGYCFTLNELAIPASLNYPVRFTEQWVWLSDYLHNWLWVPCGAGYKGCRPWRPLFILDKPQTAFSKDVFVSVSKLVYDAGCVLSDYSHGMNLYINRTHGELAFEARSSLDDVHRNGAFEMILHGLDEILLRTS